VSDALVDSAGPNPSWETLVAKDAIGDVLAKYCRAMDRMDRDLALSVWHRDGTCDYVEMFRGPASEFVIQAERFHAKMLRHSHQITTARIEVVGDRAVSEVYVTATLWSPPAETPTEMTVRGRYLDRWSRRDGRWAIDHRVFLNDMVAQRRVSSAQRGLAVDQSRRDRLDPSYALFSRGGS
jgi:hypothetical protein